MPSDTAEHQPDLQRDVASWGNIAHAKQCVAGLLSDPPPGHSVYHDLALPLPSRSVIDHLVVGPSEVIAISVHVTDEPIVRGGGRNSDTLFDGRTSLRPMLDAVDLDAAAVSELIGRPVEPVVVCLAPQLPSSSFDFRGIFVCDPLHLLPRLGSGATTYRNASEVHDRIEADLGRRPDRIGPVPTLGAPTMPPTMHANTTTRRSISARWHAVRRHASTRLALVVALAAVALAMWPALRSAWPSVSSAGSDIVVDALESAADTTAASPGPVELPAAVGMTLSCADSGDAWQVDWAWPGRPVTGAEGYGLRSRSGDAAPTVHTLTTWTDPSAPPPALLLAVGDSAEIYTDHRQADGSVVESVTAVVTAPLQACR